jgi:hypothetical protein
MKMNLSEKETRILSSILGSLIKKKVNWQNKSCDYNSYF